MFNCNPPIAHCHPLLWGGGILVDHLSTISSFDKNGPTYREQVVNPRPQIPQGKPETPLQNILVDNVNTTQGVP